MSKKDPNSNGQSVYLGKNNDGRQLEVGLRDLHVEEIDEAVEELGLGSRARAMRMWIEIGRRSMIENDPRRNQDTNTDNKSAKISDFIPEGSENAIDMRDELIDRIEENLLEVIESDPEITRDGWKVFKNEG